ncbi:helix-turn-helix domain-containing protein [Kribbella sp. NPDC051770]|uniref:helix-turn-helix domain-containing protein n=1 Tax=Kribbella sp. NPDC051770 TaxID=3155413 RepID=UPI003415E53C
MADTALEPFGVQLRRCRQAAALSLRQLATRVGYDHSYLSQVERGRRPGSADLATLCDRELAAAGSLTQAFHQLHPAESPPATAPGPGAGRVPTAPGPGAGGLPTAPGTPAGTARPAGFATSSGADLLEAVRHSMAGAFGQSPDSAEWARVTATYATDLGITPPADLLPELTADLDLLHRSAAAELAVPAAELAVLVALTLTALGRPRAAGRWWRTARATADSADARWIASQTRSWQVISTTTETTGANLQGHTAAGADPRQVSPPEGEPLRAGSSAGSELLELAVDALTLAERPQDQARALAAQARLLAILGRPEEARQAVRLLPGGVDRSGSVFGWAAYEPSSIESFVHTALRDTASAYIALDEALGLCPAERRRETAELRLMLAECLVLDGDVSTGLAMAMRTLVELEDQWHSPGLYDAGGRVLAAVQGKELTRPAVRDYRELLRRRPFAGRSVGSGSSSGDRQG